MKNSTKKIYANRKPKNLFLKQFYPGRTYRDKNLNNCFLGKRCWYKFRYFSLNKIILEGDLELFEGGIMIFIEYPCLINSFDGNRPHLVNLNKSIFTQSGKLEQEAIMDILKQLENVSIFLNTEETNPRLNYDTYMDIWLWKELQVIEGLEYPYVDKILARYNQETGSTFEFPWLFFNIFEMYQENIQ